MQWACLFLPQLALDDVLRRMEDPLAPTALVHGPRQRRILHSVNPGARALGLRPGMTLAAAQAFGIAYRAIDFDADAADRCRRLLAAWAYSYSSLVSLDLPHSVVLEIGRSRRLFGAWTQLVPRMREELRAMGFRHRVVIAPNPWAARALANVQDELIVDEGGLRARLGELPIARTGLPHDVCTALARMGLRRWRELKGLPRSSIARRFSTAVLDHIDRLETGTPASLTWHRPADRFEARIEFEYDVESSQALLFPLRRLTADLSTFLRSRDGGVQRFSLWLEHERKPDSEVVIGLLTPEREAAALFELSRGRLEQIHVPAPVRGLRLCTAELPPFVPEAGDLFDARTHQHLPWPQLRERLRARLGDTAVRPPSWRADHRPECVVLDEGLARSLPQSMPLRPGWLLPMPVACREHIDAVRSGPERIETGWWDDNDIRRDYFVVDTLAGQRLWAFRDACADTDFILHGLFG
ncbi:Y-family DNA polymerase [Lysobacter sp. HA18]